MAEVTTPRRRLALWAFPRDPFMSLSWAAARVEGQTVPASAVSNDQHGHSNNAIKTGHFGSSTTDQADGFFLFFKVSPHVRTSTVRCGKRLMTDWIAKDMFWVFYIRFWSRYALVSSIDNTREDGRFPVSASCVTISNRNPLSRSEKWADHGIRSWKRLLSAWARCQEVICGINFSKKRRAETEFDNFKPLLKSGIFKCISWLNGSNFQRWWSGFSKREIQDLSNGTNVFS